MSDAVITARRITKGLKYGNFQFYHYSDGTGYWKNGDKRLVDENMIKNSDGSYIRFNADGTVTKLYENGKFTADGLKLSAFDRAHIKAGHVYDVYISDKDGLRHSRNSQPRGWRNDDAVSKESFDKKDELGNAYSEVNGKRLYYNWKDKAPTLAELKKIEAASTPKPSNWLSQAKANTAAHIKNNSRGKEYIDAANAFIQATLEESEKLNHSTLSDEDIEKVTKLEQKLQTISSLFKSEEELKQAVSLYLQDRLADQKYNLSWEDLSTSLDNMYKTHATARKIVTLGLYAAASITGGATLAPAYALSAAEAGMAANNISREGANFNNVMDILGPAGRVLSTTKYIEPLLNSSTRFVPQLTRGTLGAIEAVDKSRIGGLAGREGALLLGWNEAWQDRAELAGSLIGFGTGRLAGGVADMTNPTATQYLSRLVAPAIKTLPENYAIASTVFPALDRWSGDNYVKKVAGYTLAGLMGAAPQLGKQYLRQGLTKWTTNELRTAGELNLANWGLNNTWSPLLGLNMSTMRGAVPSLLRPKNDPWYKLIAGQFAARTADPTMYLLKTAGENAVGGAAMSAGDLLLSDSFKEQSGWDSWKILGAQKLGETLYNKGMLTLKKGSGGTSNVGEVANQVIDFLRSPIPPRSYINQAGLEVFTHNGSGYTGVYQLRPSGDTVQDFKNNAELYPYEGFINREHDGSVENNYAAGQIIALPKNAAPEAQHRAIMAAIGGAEGRFGVGAELNHHVINASAPIDFNATVPLKNGTVGRLWLEKGPDHYVVNPEVAIIGIRGDSSFSISEPNHAIYEYQQAYKDLLESMTQKALTEQLEKNNLELNTLRTAKAEMAPLIVLFKTIQSNLKKASKSKKPEAKAEKEALLKLLDDFNRQHPEISELYHNINTQIAHLEEFAHNLKNQAEWRRNYLTTTLLPNPNSPAWNNAGHNGIIYKNPDGSYNVFEWDGPGYKGTSERYNGSVGNSYLGTYVKSLLGLAIEGGGRMVSSSSSRNINDVTKYVRTRGLLLRPVTVLDELMQATSLKKTPALMTTPSWRLFRWDLNPMHFSLNLWGDTAESKLWEKAGELRDLIQSPQFNDNVDYQNYKNRVSTTNLLAILGYDVSDIMPKLKFEKPQSEVSSQNQASYTEMAEHAKLTKRHLKLQKLINKDLDTVQKLRAKKKLTSAQTQKLSALLAQIASNRNEINSMRYLATPAEINRVRLQMEAERLPKVYE